MSSNIYYCFNAFEKYTNNTFTTSISSVFTPIKEHYDIKGKQS